MNTLPLDGIRIVDLTHDWAGPHATRLLADFGAEVIRVEYIKRLCMLRGGRTDNQMYNKHPMWFQLNRNKFSITLDLKRDEDRETFRDLLGISDALLTNSRTGVMDRLGFGYEDLVKIRPDIIMLSMAGFGNTGPFAGYAGYGATFEALGGIQSLTAYGKNEKPQRIKEMDVINGIAAAGAFMTALLHRQRTGEGQHIDFSHLEASSHALAGEHFLEYAMNGAQSLPLGNRHRVFAPQGCYRCKDETWVTLTVRSETEWKKFCDALHRPEWKTDPRFSSSSARMKNHDQLDQHIGEWTIEHSHYQAMEILQQHGIPAGAVLDVQELATNPHLRARNHFVSGVAGSDKEFLGVPFRLSSGAGKVRWRGPDLGQHNEQVLCNLLGRPEDAVKPVNEEEIRTFFHIE